MLLFLYKLIRSEINIINKANNILFYCAILAHFLYHKFIQKMEYSDIG